MTTPVARANVQQPSSEPRRPTQRNASSGEQRQDLITLSHALEDLAEDAKEKLAERPAAKVKGNHDGS